MINWEEVVESHGFKNEKQMWETLITALRSSEAIAKHLKVSKGAVHRRRTLLKIHKKRKGGKTYRQAKKRRILEQLEPAQWAMPVEDIQNYILDEYDEMISQGYISKFRRANDQ